MPIESQLREAELAFLNAPFAADGWLSAIRALADVTGSAVTQLCGGAEGTQVTFNHFSQDRHDPHGHLVNPAMYGPENWRINTTTWARTIQFERDYAAYRAHNRSPYYDDAVSDLDLPYGCQSALLMDQAGLFGLALLRSSADGPCSPETVAHFARIARQAHRAVRVQLALGQTAAESMLSHLATSSEITLLLDRYGQLLTMTEAADALFECPIGLRLDGLSVRLADESEDRALRAAMHRLLANDRLDGPVLHEVRVGRCPAKPAGWWQLLLTRLPADPAGIGFDAHLALTLRAIA